MNTARPPLARLSLARRRLASTVDGHHNWENYMRPSRAAEVAQTIGFTRKTEIANTPLQVPRDVRPIGYSGIIR